MIEAELSLSERLRELIDGYRVSQVVYVAVTLGLPDLLVGGPRTAGDLAEVTRTHPRSLYRLLRGLTSLGVLERRRTTDGETFGLTELGELLRSDVDGSLGGWAAFVARPYHWEAWGDLLRTVSTGEGFAGRHDGETVWAWRTRHPEESVIFDRAMSAIAGIIATRLANTYDFGRFSRVADIGGGDGTLLATVLPRHPAVLGLLFDQAHVVSGAQHRLEDAGVAERCEIVAGDFFEAVPSGCDAYILKSILHDWDDDASACILRRIADASDLDASLLIVERIVDEEVPSAMSVMSDLNMMVNTGGEERTLDEWQVLVAVGGFAITGTVDIGQGWNVIEARRAR